MKTKSPVHWLAILAAAAVLGACGNGTIDVRDIVPDEVTNGDPSNAIYLAITSHEDGQVITGSRTITLAGTVTSATEITAATLTATLNGGDPVTLDVEEGAFSVDLTLSDRDNVIAVLAEYQGESYEANFSLNYPFLAFDNGQDAAVVIGQPDFTSSGSGLSATGLNGPWGNPTVANDILYVPDYWNNRILGYYGIPTTHGAAADFVLGQSDFTSNESLLERGGLSGPISVAIHGETMALIDFDHKRVLIYHGLPTTTGAEPDVVIGQEDFTSNETACTADRLNADSVWLTENKLLVADAGQHRVLIWNGIPTEHGTPADLVLGQESFTECDSGTGASRLNLPYDIWSDGERVVVTDSDNYRVLIWNTFPTTNGQAADVVLGQEDMDTSASGDPSDSTFAWGAFVTSNGNQLFIGDCGARVLIWDAFPEENNVPADRVLGSATFENPPGGTTKSSLNCPSGLHVNHNQLIVSDSGNNRVMIFEAP